MKVCKWQSKVTGEVVENVWQVLKTIRHDWKKYHFMNARWQYSRKGEFKPIPYKTRYIYRLGFTMPDNSTEFVYAKTRIGKYMMMRKYERLGGTLEFATRYDIG